MAVAAERRLCDRILSDIVSICRWNRNEKTLPSVDSIQGLFGSRREKKTPRILIELESYGFWKANQNLQLQPCTPNNKKKIAFCMW